MLGMVAQILPPVLGALHWAEGEAILDYGCRTCVAEEAAGGGGSHVEYEVVNFVLEKP